MLHYMLIDNFEDDFDDNFDDIYAQEECAVARLDINLDSQSGVIY